MKQVRTYKFRLYPTKEQVEVLQKTLGVCRWVYNAALQEWRESYQHWLKANAQYSKTELSELKKAVKDGKPVNLSGYTPQSIVDRSYQGAVIRELRKELPELQGVFAHVLENVLDTLHDKTIKDFYARIKAGKKGFPRFKSASRFDSFTYPDQRPDNESGYVEGVSSKGGWNYDPQTKKLTLSKLANGETIAVKMRKHRESIGRVACLHIKREGTHWYACFVISTEKEVKPVVTPSRPVGIDLGVENLLTLSTGEMIENNRFLRQSETKLIKAQQAVSSKKRGSNRRKKAIAKLAKVHKKVANQRKDYLHKVSRNLVRTFDYIAMEDLQIANMVKRPKPKEDEQTGQFLPNGASAKAGLNKSILDAGWGMFSLYTQYKAAEAGISVVEVAPNYTSQNCSRCNTVVEKPLSERQHICPNCGLSLHRDHNAAINILKKGLGNSLQGVAIPFEKIFLGLPIQPVYLPKQPKTREA